MDESQLAGALAFCRLVLNQPELQIDDICKANVVNRIIADFDKRPTIKQCEPNPNVSYDVIFRTVNFRWSNHFPESDRFRALYLSVSIPWVVQSESRRFGPTRTGPSESRRPGSK